MRNAAVIIETTITDETVDQFAFTLAAFNAGLTPASPDFVTAAQLAESLIRMGLAGHHAQKPRRLNA